MKLFHFKKSFESMVFGPTPAPIFKLRNKYRYRILIKFEKSSIYKHKIRECLMKIIFNKGTKKLKLMLIHTIFCKVFLFSNIESESIL